MAIGVPPRCTYPGRETAKTRLRLYGLSSLAPIRTIFVVVSAMGVTGCAHYPADLEAMNSAQRVVRAASVSVRAHVREERQPAAKLANMGKGRTTSIDAVSQSHAELRDRRPDPSLLAPQPDPKCDLKVSDGTELGNWAQVEVERQCYRDAEKAARERISQLQEYLRSSERPQGR